MIWSQRPKTFLYQEKLVELILPREHRIAIDKFSQNTANSPNVDFLWVWSSNQKFRGSIPSSSYIVSKLLFVRRTFQLSGEPIIAYFQLFFVANEQIFRLDVPMDYIERVHIRQTFEKLVHKQSDVLGLQPIWWFFQHLKQVVLDVLEDEVDYAFFAKSFLELYDVGVLEHF